MKTTTMLIIGVAAVGAYYAYTSSTTKPATVFGLGGSQTIQVDGNMSDAEITAMTSNWNNAVSTANQSAAQAVITQMQTANHPKAAAALQGIMTQAQQQFGNSMTAGYSAGALNRLTRIGNLTYVHRLAMAGAL